MTEPEVIESMAILGDGAVNVFTVFISVTFAYLTVAYFVGRSLSRFQLLAISGLYFVTAATMGATCVACVLAWEKLAPRYPSVLNDIPFFTIGIWHLVMACIFTVGIVVSFYFMYNIRSTNPEDSNQLPQN